MTVTLPTSWRSAGTTLPAGPPSGRSGSVTWSGPAATTTAWSPRRERRWSTERPGRPPTSGTEGCGSGPRTEARCTYHPPTSQARNDETGRPFVELAYASTVHSAQGRTVDRAVVVVGAHTEAELLYVGMTRGRQTNLAVADAGDDDAQTLFLAALQNPSTDAVAALELVAHHRRDKAKRKARERAEREQAEREATLRFTAPDTTERDIADGQDDDLYALAALATAQLDRQEQERIAQERAAAAAKAEAARKQERIQATHEKLKQLWEADQAEARTRRAAHRKRAAEQTPVIQQLRRRRDQLAAKDQPSGVAGNGPPTSTASTKSTNR